MTKGRELIRATDLEEVRLIQGQGSLLALLRLGRRKPNSPYRGKPTLVIPPAAVAAAGARTHSVWLPVALSDLQSARRRFATSVSREQQPTQSRSCFVPLRQREQQPSQRL